VPVIIGIIFAIHSFVTKCILHFLTHLYYGAESFLRN